MMLSDGLSVILRSRDFKILDNFMFLFLKWGVCVWGCVGLSFYFTSNEDAFLSGMYMELSWNLALQGQTMSTQHTSKFPGYQAAV